MKNIKIKTVFGALLFVFPVLAIAARPPSEVVPQVPNIQVFPAGNFVYENRLSDGNQYVRFSMTSWNAGAGPLEFVGGVINTVNQTQEVKQRVYNSDGTYAEYKAGDFVWHEAHSHVHLENYAKYTLEAVDAPGNSLRTSEKVTFCLIDNTKVNTRLSGAPKKAQYNTCGFGVQGLSVGWGDTYPNVRPGQEFNVTGLPSGEYNVVMEADPLKRFVESNENDNISVVKVYIDQALGTVTVLP